MTWWHGQYIIAAGSYAGGKPSALYTRDGVAAPQPRQQAGAGTFNPEAFFTPESRDKMLVLNDEGENNIAGIECKKLRDSGKKRFSGLWINLNE